MTSRRQFIAGVVTGVPFLRAVAKAPAVQLPVHTPVPVAAIPAPVEETFHVMLDDEFVLPLGVPPSWVRNVTLTQDVIDVSSCSPSHDATCPAVAAERTFFEEARKRGWMEPGFDIDGDEIEELSDEGQAAYKRFEILEKPPCSCSPTPSSWKTCIAGLARGTLEGKIGSQTFKAIGIGHDATGQMRFRVVMCEFDSERTVGTEGYKKL